MAKDPIKLPCGTCKGAGQIRREYKSTPDPTNPKRVETSYRYEPCGKCGGRGTIN